MKTTPWLICSSSSCGGCHVQQREKENKTLSLKTRKQVVWKQDETIFLTCWNLAVWGCEERAGWQERRIKYIILFITVLPGDGISPRLRYYLLYHGKATELTFSLLGTGARLHFTAALPAWLNVGRNILFLTKMGNRSWAFKSSANCRWLLQQW